MPFGRITVSIALTTALLAGTAAAQQPFDQSKYPDIAGQWQRVGPLGVFDSTKPSGRGQQAPLTPEYQAIFEANLADVAFAGAISKTSPAGEINVLDPGGFGAVTITKAITIRADHVEGGVLVSGTNGIAVAAGATDTVVLEGLDFDGTNTGLNGVQITSGLQVYIIRCAIRRFTQNGVNLVSNTPNARAIIRDSFISLNGSSSSTPPSTFGGVNVQGNGVGNVATIINTEIDANTTFAIQATNTGNILGVANSVLNASPTAISLVSGAIAVSFGPSNVVSGAGAFTITNAFK